MRKRVHPVFSEAKTRWHLGQVFSSVCAFLISFKSDVHKVPVNALQKVSLPGAVVGFFVLFGVFCT